MAVVEPAELHRPEGEWPLILCGPIVRRVTRTSAAVFVAAKEAFAGTLTVYDGTDETRQALPQGSGGQQSVALGRMLHVCVLESTDVVLEPGRLYGYDVTLVTESGTHDLDSLDLLDQAVPLGYERGHLPAFVLPGSLDRLKVAHGSCRKPHGCVTKKLDDPDVLPLVDRLIELNRSDPYARVQQLLLTGDQVYSDDVPAALLAASTLVGRTLLAWGRPEVFPDRRGAESFTDDHVRIEPGDRSYFLHDQGVKDRPAYSDPEAWSDYAANHLLFFSEWCAMYLFAWSPELWQLRDNVDPDDRLAHPKRSYFYLAEADRVWSDSPDTTTPALVYAQGLPYVRRALANVATYMMFDDHDVTDDWFLNQKVDEQLRGRREDHIGPGGRRMMRNALAAYAVFQHWGNVPEAFRPGTPGGRLLELLDASGGTPPIGQAGREDDADVILDVGATAIGVARRDERIRWDYELVHDEHRLIMLDARTWRGYPISPRRVDAAELLEAAADRAEDVGEWGPEALRMLATSWADAADRGTGQVVVFLRSACEVMRQAADLSEAYAAKSPTWTAKAHLLLEECLIFLDAVAEAAVFDGQAWTEDVLRAAQDAATDAELPSGIDAVNGAMATSAVLNEMAFRLRTGTSAWLQATGLSAVTLAGLAARRALEDLADLFAHLAAFFQGAAVSFGRSARFAAALARTWLALAADQASAMWRDLSADTAAALDDAAVESASTLESLDVLYRQHKTTVDTVWSLLVGDGSKKLNAELISAEALAFQVTERVARVADRRELTLVVSPGPVIGHWLAEFAQRVQVLRVEHAGGSGDETWDNEPWSGNAPAFTRFLDALCDLGSVVLLSGDVHYASSSVTDYLSRAGKAARFVQLTSSATKNADAKTKAFGKLDETTDDLLSMAMLEFDFVELLPSAAEWAQLPQDVRDLVPTDEEAATNLAQTKLAIQETIGDQVAAAETWWNTAFDFGKMRNAVERQGEDAWDSVKLRWAQQTESAVRAVTELTEDPFKAFVGDRLAAHPLMQEQLLLLLGSLGIDPEELPEVHTTVLRDRRATERANDSPGLGARLDKLFATSRNIRVRMDRTTVGHNNMGVITTQRTPLGRYITHELHWFPFDTTEEQVDPGRGDSFRDDWIITRHVAGLVTSTPPDGGLVGVPAPGDVVVAGLELDMTSPTQVQDGQRRIHQIAPAGPTMPDLTVTVRVPGLTAAQDLAQPRQVRLECSYVMGATNDPLHRNDVTHLPGPGPDTWVTLPAGTHDWSPTFAEPCGGELTVFAEATVGGQPLAAATAAGAHVIWGVNPAKQEIRDRVGDRVNVHVVFHRESRFNQFAESSKSIGRTVTGPHTVLRSDDSGYGLGQLTTPRPTSQELWDWKANVDGSVGRLDAFRADALRYQELVRQGLPWEDNAIGSLKSPPPSPPPPNEGTAYPDAPVFTEDQLDLEMWARYNSGRRYHDYHPPTSSWVKQPSTNTALTGYAPECLAMRNQVAAGDYPNLWF